MNKSSGEQMRKLRLACKARKTDRAIKLLKNSSKKVINECLCDAVDNFDGNLDLVKAFVDHGANVNVKWKAGDIDVGVYITPLFIAIRNINLPVVEYLISVGADVRYCNPDIAAFPLMFALGTFPYGEELTTRDIIKVLIRNGADVNEDGGFTLLTMVSNIECSEETWREVFELFIQHGANFKLQPFLYRACSVKNDVAIKYILNSGMKPSEEIRSRGHTALHIATGDCKLSPSRNQWWKKPESDVELLLEWGANVDDQVVATGYTALHYACANADIIKLASLLNYGANIDVLTVQSGSVLFKLLDSLCKDKQLKDYLISSSGDDEAKSDIDKNSANQRLELYAKMVKLLVASGARLMDNEWLVEYDAPYVVMAADILRSDSPFLRRIRGLISELKDTLRRPRSLADLCRSKIRSCVTGKKSARLDQLSPWLVSAGLVDYLVYRDIFPEHKYW